MDSFSLKAEKLLSDLIVSFFLSEVVFFKLKSSPYSLLFLILINFLFLIFDLFIFSSSILLLSSSDSLFCLLISLLSSSLSVILFISSWLFKLWWNSKFFNSFSFCWNLKRSLLLNILLSKILDVLLLLLFLYVPLFSRFDSLIIFISLLLIWSILLSLWSVNKIKSFLFWIFWFELFKFFFVLYLIFEIYLFISSVKFGLFSINIFFYFIIPFS